jgi:hypothetical protein
VLSRPTAPQASQRGGDLRRLGDVGVRYGFRRVERVHLRRVDGGLSATVTGITHRYPRSVRVPLSVARRLIAAGAPLTVDGVASPRRVNGA